MRVCSALCRTLRLDLIAVHVVLALATVQRERVHVECERAAPRAYLSASRDGTGAASALLGSGAARSTAAITEASSASAALP